MLRKYILDGHTPVPCDDLEQLGEWLESADRIVRQETVCGIFVSTIFLTLDHNFQGEGAPVLFETMLSPDVEWFPVHTRYCTWDEALTGHRLIVELLKQKLSVHSSIK